MARKKGQSTESSKPLENISTGMSSENTNTDQTVDKQRVSDSMKTGIKLKEYLVNKKDERVTLMAGFKIWCEKKGIITETFNKYEQLLDEYKNIKIN